MIASVDPGTYESAYLLFDPANQRIVDMGIYDNAELLTMLRLGCRRMTHFAIEQIASYGFTVGQEVFDTVLWSGRFLEATHKHATPILVKRKQVLAHFRAKNDATLRAALINRFGTQTKCVYDLWAALGVAAFASDSLGGKKQ